MISLVWLVELLKVYDSMKSWTSRFMTWALLEFTLILAGTGFLYLRDMLFQSLPSLILLWELFDSCVYVHPLLSFIFCKRALKVDVLSSVGVLFTHHPVTSNPSRMIINANYGLGEVCEKKPLTYSLMRIV